MTAAPPNIDRMEAHSGKDCIDAANYQAAQEGVCKRLNLRVCPL